MEKETMLIQVPEGSMPRERLARCGEKNLENYELLAIMLRTGTKDLNVLELSQLVLNTFEDLYSLKMATVEELMKIPGVGKIRAMEIRAMIELGIRMSEAHQPKKAHLNSSRKAGEWIASALKDSYQEQLLAVYLNTKNQVIKQKIIFQGGLNHAVAHPREIFREAVRCSAANVIIGHNHPSGDTAPSQADIDFTERMKFCGELMGIQLLDHFIVGDGQYLSMKEEGYLE